MKQLTAAEIVYSESMLSITIGRVRFPLRPVEIVNRGPVHPVVSAVPLLLLLIITIIIAIIIIIIIMIRIIITIRIIIKPV